MTEEKSKEMESLIKEAKLLGIKTSKVSMAGFKGKDKPEKVIKEDVRQKKLITERLKKRIAKAKAVAGMKPIDKRRAVLVARFKAVKSKTRPRTYSDANIKAWLEELQMINDNPKAWNKITANGTKNYTPSNKKKRTARDILDEMDLE